MSESTFRLAAIGLCVPSPEGAGPEEFERLVNEAAARVPSSGLPRLFLIPELSTLPLVAGMAIARGMNLDYATWEIGERTKLYDDAWDVTRGIYGRLAKKLDAYVVAGALRPTGRGAQNVAPVFAPDGTEIFEVRGKHIVGDDEKALGIVSFTDTSFLKPHILPGLPKTGILICRDAWLEDDGSSLWPIASAPILLQPSANDVQFSGMYSDDITQAQDWIKSTVAAVASGNFACGACAMLQWRQFNGPSYVIKHSSVPNMIPFPGISKHYNVEFLAYEDTYGARHNIAYADITVSAA